MPIQTALQKNNMAAAYAATAVYGAIYTTAPGASAGTEPTGGSPAYARKAITWGTAGAVGPLGAGSQAATPGVVYGQATFDIPSGTTVVGYGYHTAATGGSYLDGGALTSQPFNTQGTVLVNFSYTQV